MFTSRVVYDVCPMLYLYIDYPSKYSNNNQGQWPLPWLQVALMMLIIQYPGSHTVTMGCDDVNSTEPYHHVHVEVKAIAHVQSQNYPA